MLYNYISDDNWDYGDLDVISKNHPNLKKQSQDDVDLVLSTIKNI